MLWKGGFLLPVVLLVSACGGSGDAGSSTTDEVTSVSSAGATTTQSATSATSTTTAGPTSTATSRPSTTTTSVVEIPAISARASGSGVVNVDGEEFVFEVYACGWLVTATDPTHPGGEFAGDDVYWHEQADRPTFEINGIARQADGRVVELNLRWRGRVAAVTGSVAIADLDDPSSAQLLQTFQNSTSQVAIEGGRFTTVEPLTMGPFGDRSSVEVDATCETFGGTTGTLGEIAAAIIGIDLPQAAGEIVVDGVVFPVTSTDVCIVQPEGAEMVGTAGPAGAEVQIQLATGGGVELVQIVQLSGQVLFGLGSEGQFFNVIAGRLVADGITLEGSDGVDSTVSFDVGCET